MSERGLLEVAVVGATGALGGELVNVLAERALPIGRLVPVATDRSLGEHVEWGGADVPVEVELGSLEGVDLAFLCAPRDASLEFAGLALRARVPAIDLSGALLDQPDVDLLVGEWLDSDEVIDRPLVASPGGTALALALVLMPLEQAAGVGRAIVTTFEAAAVTGRAGMDALSSESVALFNQQPLPDEPLAFDCRPAVGAPGADGATGHELRLATTVSRLLGREIALGVTSVRVPTFSGDGLSVFVETERPLDVGDAVAALEKASGVVVWPGGAGPSSRTAVEQDAALVGRVRAAPGGLQLWISADGIRLAARNAALLAEARPLQRRAS